MEAGFPKVNHRMLLGFPKGPGTQGPGPPEILHIWTLGIQDPNGIPKKANLEAWNASKKMARIRNASFRPMVLKQLD